MSKPLRCRVFGHDWHHTMTVGENRAFRCERGMCPAEKVVSGGVTLEPEDARVVLDQMHKQVRAVMWVMDNVQPAYSSDGTGTEQDGSADWERGQR